MILGVLLAAFIMVDAPTPDGRQGACDTAAFTKDFYMGVYEITQGQAEGRWLGRTETPSTRGSDGWKMKPLSKLFYNDLRGADLGGLKRRAVLLLLRAR